MIRMKVSSSNWENIFSLTTVFYLMLILTIFLSIHQYLLPESNFWGHIHPQYNNYRMFKSTFSHLLQNDNLYLLYPDKFGDYYKYSPTFALFMGVFYFVPDWLGLITWNIVNVIVLFISIKFIPRIDNKTKVFILLFGLLELIGSIQNEQSNGIITGLIILSFYSFEKKKLWLAALLIALSVYIKLFGIVACALFLLYPNKFRFAAFFSFWMIALWALPLVVINPDELIKQYFNWFELLEVDHTNRYGFSVFGVLYKWLHIEASKGLLLVSGVLIFCSVYIRKDLFQDYGFRLLLLSSILIWVILFNHTAESPGYIICMTGIGIWYFIQAKNRFNTILVIAAFIMVSVIYSDIVPSYYRVTYLYPYFVKTIPVIAIWLRLLYEMLFKKYQLKEF